MIPSAVKSLRFGFETPSRCYGPSGDRLRGMFAATSDLDVRPFGARNKFSIFERSSLMTFNSISIIGYLGQDPVAGQTINGTASSRFSVATTERRKTSEGEAREHTSWFRVTAYGRLAEIAQAHLAKGRQVFIRGRLRLEEYTDREGTPRTSAEVTATDLLLLSAAPASESSEVETMIEESLGSMADEEAAKEPTSPKR